MCREARNGNKIAGRNGDGDFVTKFSLLFFSPTVWPGAGFGSEIRSLQSMSVPSDLRPVASIVLIGLLAGRLIQRKRAGQWKRPWSFPIAMILLGLATVLVSLGTVLKHFGM
jgi:hypothetical protein